MGGTGDVSQIRDASVRKAGATLLLITRASKLSPLKRVRLIEILLHKGAGVLVGIGVEVLVAVDVGTSVAVDVGTSVAVDVGMSVVVDVGVSVTVDVTVLVGTVAMMIVSVFVAVGEKV